MVVAKTFAGDLSFNPLEDSIRTPDGKKFKFEPPVGKSLPAEYENADFVYLGPPETGAEEVHIDPSSDRLQRLEPFNPWNGQDYTDLPILIKVKGKCTTDHISPAGPWIRYRGHLENISENTLIRAVNADNEKANSVRNVFTGEYDSVPAVARDYKARGSQWVIIADHNYGEGSSREHAALQPRYLNGVAVIAKSLARIHEANLKKQGLLPLTFDKESDYDRITPSDRISLLNLQELTPGKPVTMRVCGQGGTAWTCKLNHTFTEEQIWYFRHGSALNYMGSLGGGKLHVDATK